MSTRPVITIFGVTGAQGASLARAILADPSRSFAVRAVTARHDGEEAHALASCGAEIKTADFDDAASLERAMHGTYGAFVAASAWEHFSSAHEFVPADHILRAARRVNARHVIWSTLDTRHCAPLDDSRLPTPTPRCNVPLRDAKDAAETSFHDLPLTILRTSFCWDNLLHFDIGLQRAPDGVLDFALPLGDRPVAGIAVVDIGPCALSIFQCCGQFIGRTVGIAGDLLQGGAMAEALARAVGEPVRHVPMSISDYPDLGFPDAVESTRELYPGLMGFDQWLDKNVESLRTLSRRHTENNRST